LLKEKINQQPYLDGRIIHPTNALLRRCWINTGASAQKSPNRRRIRLVTEQRVLCRKDLPLL
jgi:hypothetical protein